MEMIKEASCNRCTSCPSDSEERGRPEHVNRALRLEYRRARSPGTGDRAARRLLALAPLGPYGRLCRLVTRQRRHSRSKWTRRLVRLLSMIVLALVMSQLTVAYAFVAVDDCGESCPDDDDQGDDPGDCPCPLDCASGCCAARVPAVPPSSSVPVLLAPSAVELLLLLPERAPPSPEAREVLHVPRYLA